MVTRAAFVSALLFALAGCENWESLAANARIDGGLQLSDAGGSDAGGDGGLDAGTPDAGTPDAGAPDAGEPDAGADAGIDSGVSCALGELTVSGAVVLPSINGGTGVTMHSAALPFSVTRFVVHAALATPDAGVTLTVVGGNIALDANGDSALLNAGTYSLSLQVGGPPCPMNRTYSLNVSSRDVLAANLIEELSNDAGPDFALLGRSIALSSDVVLLGAPGEDLVAPDGGMLSRAGRAYVFERTDGGWAASATLSPPTPHTVGEFGTAVALDTDTAAISEPEYGQVHVFARDDAGWRYVQSVRGSNTESGNGSQADLDGFGNAVALGLGRLVVGAPREDDSAVGVGPPNNDENALNSGAVYVFTRDTDGGWPQTDYLKADARSVGAQFGSALAFDGRRLVVGAPFEATNVTGINPTRPMTSPSLDESGAVFVFDKGNSWNQVVWAKAPNPDQGDWFGLSVALSGARVVIGAPRERSAQRTQPADNGLMEAGAAYVLTQDAGWAFTDYLKATTPTMTESFGASVGVSGDVIAVGAPRARSGAVEHGAVYVFSTLDGASWVDRGKYSSTRPEIGQRFGEPLVVGPNSFIGCAAVASPQSRGACWERRFQSP